MAYRYRITIEKLGVRAGSEQDGTSLQFCIDNHDYLLKNSGGYSVETLVRQGQVRFAGDRALTFQLDRSRKKT
jgi:hypothetical protein